MSQLARLDKLWPFLSAKERGILVLRSLKTGEREDYRLRTTMPSTQAREFNHYIALMNGVNLDVSTLLLVLREILLRLQTLAHLICMTQLWAISNRRTRLFLDSLPVPITASDYDKEKARAAQETLTFDGVAELLADHRYDIGDQDFSQMSEEEEEAAWNEMMNRAGADLDEAVKSGRVETGKDGTGIRLSSFFDWLGEPLPVYPDVGLEYDVRPDAEADRVSSALKLRQSAVDSLKDGPGSDWCPLPKSEETEEGERESTGLAGEAVAAVRGQLVALWAEAATVEGVFTEVGEEFDGEDPAHSKVRGLLEEVLQGCRELAKKNEFCLGRVEPPEPTREEKDAIWELVNKWAEVNL